MKRLQFTAFGLMARDLGYTQTHATVEPDLYPGFHSRRGDLVQGYVLNMLWKEVPRCVC